MKFDFTKGKSPKYMVSIYGELIEDKIIYHYYRDAMSKFASIVAQGQPQGVAVSVYDMTKDVRKAYKKF